MAAKLTEIRIDHDGDPLPPGVYALAREDGAIVGYKVRWREEGDDGVRRNAAKRFSVRKLGSLERARAEATAYRQAAIEIAGRGELVLRPDSAARMTVGDLFKEWITEHAALNLSERYATDAVRWWDREIATRVWRTRSQLELAVVEYIGWFNDSRLHQALDDRPPSEFERLSQTSPLEIALS